jgi:hypothetical protein
VRLSKKKAAAEFGVSPDTFDRKMVAAGHDVKGRQEFTILEIFRALSTSDNIRLRKETASARKTEAEARMLEQEERLRSGELVELSEVIPIIELMVSASRQADQSLVTIEGPKANIADPELAQSVLRDAVDRKNAMAEDIFRRGLAALQAKGEKGAQETKKKVRKSKSKP